MSREEKNPRPQTLTYEKRADDSPRIRAIGFLGAGIGVLSTLVFLAPSLYRLFKKTGPDVGFYIMNLVLLLCNWSIVGRFTTGSATRLREFLRQLLSVSTPVLALNFILLVLWLVTRN